ncbi:MAG: formate--tetrahydrofolate ligase [Pseudomonadota bacterium]|nr:formate--tetrahydrofolate ligase [Pseudomonadota bacterium]
MRPIAHVAAELGLAPEHVHPWGPGRAKIALEAAGPSKGRLVLVSAITPTPAGEGKTTMAISLALGLRQRGASVAVALREPSIGPVFGKKGGGTGGGRATLEPANAINLHNTGDLHAIAAAHNLLAAMVDNALHFRAAGLDARKTRWRRVIDMNDRALRSVIVGLGSAVRESGFDITAASEVMAALCLAEDRADLESRLGRLIVGEDTGGRPITANDLGATGAMSALLAEAVMPTLVQTSEGGAAFVHGGPFANIAHGCNSRIATRMALAHADIVLTEAGFAFDLGGEKFLDIKARAPGLWPSMVALVVTRRALLWHGEGELEQGLRLLDHHLGAVARFGLPAMVVLNRFPDDTPADIDRIRAFCDRRGAAFAPCDGYAHGGEGAHEAADTLQAVLGAPGSKAAPTPRWLYPLDAPLVQKLEAVATTMYAASGVTLDDGARKDLARIEALGGGSLPVCIAKTPLSLTDDSTRKGLPGAHTLRVRELRLYAGAGFVVALAGDVQTMPGLPKTPAAAKVRVEPDGRIRGLMQED